nr:DUF1156 domain-containing protein [Gemmatimonadota bacterium]
MKRKFIEYDLPLAEISEQSAREKNIRHGHPSTLHIWWARRPLASSRATALAALIDDPRSDTERKRITDLIEKVTPWEAVKEGNSDEIKRARSTLLKQFGGRPPKVLDPFSGGGSIPLEALRLGCEAYAIDYNPVAVLIEKATLEWPAKFGKKVRIRSKISAESEEQLTHLERDGSKSVNMLRFLATRWANNILADVRKAIDHVYRADQRDTITRTEWYAVAFIWARTLPCQNPSCGAEIPLFRQSWLAKKSKSLVAYRPVIDEPHRSVTFEILDGKNLTDAVALGFDPGTGTVQGANASCLICGQVVPAKQVRTLAQQGEMGDRMIVVVEQHPKQSGKRYRVASDEDRKLFGKAEEHLQERIRSWPYMESPIPDEEIPLMSGTFNAPIYGWDRHNKIFNSRQQLALLCFSAGIRQSFKAIVEDCKAVLQTTGQDHLDSVELAQAVVGYLGIILDQTILKNNTLARWNNLAEKTEYFISNNGIPMMWDYPEVNPLADTAGSWPSYQYYVLNAVHGASEALTDVDVDVRVEHGSATALRYPDGFFDAVLTDPPYYNSVPYADLSDFFYVWLKRTIGEHFPSLFATPLTPKLDEITEMAGWDPDRYGYKDKAFFETRLGDAFKEIHRVLKDDGVAIIVYAHKTTEGWETMLNGLSAAGLVVTASWPIHTEMRGRLRAAQSAALASSIYMVCRKVQREPLGFWNDIQPQVKTRVEEKLTQFWKEGIAGGDFFISAIGPALSVYGRHSKVMRPDGTEVTVREFLDL